MRNLIALIDETRAETRNLNWRHGHDAFKDESVESVV